MPRPSRVISARSASTSTAPPAADATSRSVVFVPMSIVARFMAPPPTIAGNARRKRDLRARRDAEVEGVEARVRLELVPARIGAEVVRLTFELRRRRRVRLLDLHPANWI